MPYFLIAIAALSFGWLTREGFLSLLESFDRRRNSERLQKILEKGARPLPLRGIIAGFEKVLQLGKNLGILRIYLGRLAELIRRMNRPEIQPIQLFGYQILAALATFFPFWVLSDSLWLAVLSMGIGAALPILWARDQANLREKAILQELPNALEILALCSEAGLTLEQAMDQYLKNARKGPLHVEFSGVLEQTRSGASRKSALEAASFRLNLTDFSLFSTSLIQAERFGTGVSKTLRQLSLTMRDKQSQRAEKAVQEIPVKLLFPLILCIMPVTFLIIFGPILLQFFQP